MFGAEHPLGSILGKAKYSDGLFVYQGVTIGGNKGKYPVIGRNVTLYSNSRVIGESIIGDNVVISAETYIKDQNIPPNSLVFGKSPNRTIIIKSDEYIYRYLEIIH